MEAITHPSAAFHAAGLYTFPVRMDAATFRKVPLVTGWQKADMPPRATTAVNYGVRLNDEYFVIDVDTRRSSGKVAEGQESWNKLQALLKRPLSDKQFIVSTMNGGRHYWFKKPAGMRTRYKVPGFPGIEFLTGTGHFVVGVGTDFNHGLPYSAIQGEFNEEGTPPLPDEILQVVQEIFDQQYQREDFDFADTPLAIDAYTKFLKHFPAAIEGAGGEGTTFQACCTARDLGLTPEKAFQLLANLYNPRCQPQWSLPELEIKVNNAYKYASGGVGSQNYFNRLGAPSNEQNKDMDYAAAQDNVIWHRDKNGRLVNNDEDNVINLLTVKCHGSHQHPVVNLFRFNELSQEIEFARIPPWFDPLDAKDFDPLTMPLVLTDEQVSNLKRFFSQTFDFKATRETMYAGIEHAARRMTYHPIRCWLKHLVWDGQPRLSSWLTEFLDAEDTVLNEQIGQAVLCGAVSRALHPGKKWDYVLTLEGPQGSMKSKVCETLAVHPSWFASLQPDTDKDTRMAFGRKWIIELAEIDSLSRRDAAQVKAFITTQVDTMRVPYGKLTRDYQRQSICIGTVNPNAAGQYFNDPTGNRRFWPVQVGVIDIVGLENAREQLYAEAMVRYKELGVKALYLSGEADRMAREEVRKRQNVDPFVEQLEDWFKANPEVESAGFTHLAINALGLNAAQHNKKVRDRMLSAAAYMDCEVIGGNRDIMRAPGFHPLDVLKPLEGILEKRIFEIRGQLTTPIEIGTVALYGMVVQELFPEIPPEAKQSFARRVKNVPGVTGTGVRKNGVRILRIEPLSLEEKYPV